MNVGSFELGFGLAEGRPSVIASEAKLSPRRVGIASPSARNDAWPVFASHDEVDAVGLPS